MESSIQSLLSECWVNYKADLHPKDRRMDLLRSSAVRGMGTENTAFFINEIVRLFAFEGTYLEVGTFQGYSLLSAAILNPSTRCIGIDNFSQFNSKRQNETCLKENLRKFNSPANIEFYNGDYKEVLRKLFSKEADLKVDVYFYDGDHSYENQSEGLRAILPHLSRRCVILVDDVNWEFVERANGDFVAKNPEFKSVFKIKTEGSATDTWWNGFEVLAR